jgi:hypothetical protein
MSSAPLKRVYFDTNILFHGPHLPNNVQSIFGVAKWVGTEMYMPSVVEDELEAEARYRAAIHDIEALATPIDKAYAAGDVISA